MHYMLIYAVQKYRIKICKICKICTIPTNIDLKKKKHAKTCKNFAKYVSMMQNMQ